MKTKTTAKPLYILLISSMIFGSLDYGPSYKQLQNVASVWPNTLKQSSSSIVPQTTQYIYLRFVRMMCSERNMGYFPLQKKNILSGKMATCSRVREQISPLDFDELSLKPKQHQTAHLFLPPSGQRWVLRTPSVCFGLHIPLSTQSWTTVVL